MMITVAEGTSKARILIVEDEGIIASDLEERLIELGYEVAGISPSGEEAVTRAADLKPDLVLMDIMLKGEMDGVEASGIIRKNMDIPVIFLTSFSDDQTLGRARITEPYGYILKPFEERELNCAISMALYKHEMEMKLRQSERWLSTTLKSIGDGVIATDRSGRVVFMNPVAERLTGWSGDEAFGRALREVFDVDSEEKSDIVDFQINRVLGDGEVTGLPEKTFLRSRPAGEDSPEEIAIDDSASPIVSEQDGIIGMVIVFKDSTEKRRAEQERESLISELKEALDDIKTLRGLLPICASCKKIRDDKGYWRHIEEYLRTHADVEFTHGMCPSCVHKFYESSKDD